MIRNRKGVAWWGGTPGARKAARQSEKRRIINKMRMSKMKTLVKKVLSSTDKSNAEVAFKAAQKTVMKGTSTGVIRLNKASRIISKLSKKVKIL